MVQCWSKAACTLAVTAVDGRRKASSPRSDDSSRHRRRHSRRPRRRRPRHRGRRSRHRPRRRRRRHHPRPRTDRPPRHRSPARPARPSARRSSLSLPCCAPLPRRLCLRRARELPVGREPAEAGIPPSLDHAPPAPGFTRRPAARGLLGLELLDQALPGARPSRRPAAARGSRRAGRGAPRRARGG